MLKLLPSTSPSFLNDIPCRLEIREANVEAANCPSADVLGALICANLSLLVWMMCTGTIHLFMPITVYVRAPNLGTIHALYKAKSYAG
jgi:hypothetical protein